MNANGFWAAHFFPVPHILSVQSQTAITAIDMLIDCFEVVNTHLHDFEESLLATHDET